MIINQLKLMKMSCYKYWGKLEEIANILSKYKNKEEIDNTDIEKIIKILDEVELIAHDKIIDFNSAKHILDDKKMNKVLKLIRKFYIYVGSRLETENAISIIESENPKAELEKFHFYERYTELINNESRLANFNKDTTFLFLGSGPLPLTLIMFNKIFHCKCIGIEQNEDTALLSREVLKKLELDQEIKIEIGDERKIKDLDYDILMIAAFAEPKERVFANVWETVNEKTAVIYRTYSGMRAILYSPVTEKDTRGFEKEVMLLPQGNSNNTSVLIKKIQ